VPSDEKGKDEKTGASWYKTPESMGIGEASRTESWGEKFGPLNFNGICILAGAVPVGLRFEVLEHVSPAKMGDLRCTLGRLETWWGGGPEE